MKSITLKHLILLFMLLTTGKLSFAQEELQNLLTRRQVGCDDISLNSSELIPYYINKSEMDSALIILNYWGEKCGNSEPASRANILLALNLHFYETSMLPPNFLAHMDFYHKRLEIITDQQNYLYNYYQNAFDFVPVGGVFDQWTQDFASEMIDFYDEGTEEYLLCLFYSGNTDLVYQLMLTDKYANTKPGVQYNNAVVEVMKLPLISVGINAGTWIPTGQLSSMGVHPEIGFTYGVKYFENQFDLVMAVKFARTPNEYLARRDKNSPQELTHYFSGGYIGIEYTRYLLPMYKNNPFFSAGIAYDGFTMLESDDKNDIKAATTNSYNLSLGGGYKMKINNTSSLGLQLRYNLVDYTLNKLFDKRGNVFSIRLSYTFMQNVYRENRLKRLHYPGI